MLSMQTSENCPCSFQGHHVRLYVAWRTLLVYTNNTVPYARFALKKRHGFCAKAREKNMQRHGHGVQAQIINVATFLKIFVTRLGKKTKLGTNYKNYSDQTQYR